MNIILYTTHCPRCIILKQKLDDANIKYEIEEDVNRMIELGISDSPRLGVDGKLLSFVEAVEYINQIK